MDRTTTKLVNFATRLRLEDPGIVPEDFLLQIGHADPRPCRIVWRAQHQLGIAFVQRAG